MNLDFFRPTERLSSQARFYDRRPEYPAEVIVILRRDLDLEPRHVAADVGAGTGKLTKLFLENGNRVFALEPNAENRAHVREDEATRPNGKLT